MERIKQLLQAEFGTLGALSEHLNVGQSAVYNWLAKRHIPIKHLKKIEELSEGRITRKMLRPDIFGE